MSLVTHHHHQLAKKHVRRHLNSHKIDVREDESENERQLKTKRSARSDKHGASKPVSSAAIFFLGAAGLYSGIKGVLQGYQLLRRSLLRQLVFDVCTALDQLGVQHWADFGTLLGAYREKDIILHDNDADIVVLGPDWEALRSQLQPCLPHSKVYFVVPSEDTSIRWLRVSSGGIGVLDLYGGFDHGGKSIEIPQGHGDLCDLPKHLLLPLSRMDFRGCSISVPHDVTGVLTYRYGETFMIPRYMDKGRDSVEQNKPYARLLGLLGRAGLCV